MYKEQYFQFMSKSNKNKFVAIDPGTKEMGIAFFEGEELIYHSVKVIKNRTSPNDILQEGRLTIQRIIRDFEPSILVIEKTFVAHNRNAALLNVLAEEIKSIAKRKGLSIREIAPSTVKKHICGNGGASKEEVAKAIVSKYPELKVYITNERKWKKQFHENMFDAVALGVVVIESLLKS